MIDLEENKEKKDMKIKWYHIIGIIGTIFLIISIIDISLQDNKRGTIEDVFIPNTISVIFPILFLIFIMIWLGASIENEVKRK